MRHILVTAVLVAASWVLQVAPSSAQADPDGRLLARSEIEFPSPEAFVHIVLDQSETSSVRDVRAEELKFYGNAQPYLDESIPILKKKMRDLEGLRAENQDGLHAVLNAAAENLRELLENLPDLISNETLTQTEWTEPQTPICTGMSGCLDPKPVAEKNQQFNYIILTHPEGDRHLLLEEYRTTRDGRALKVGEEPHFKGFTSFWSIFTFSNLEESHFRYLGEQRENGRATQVVAFEQIPGLVKSPATIVTPRGSVPMLLQGIAWFDQKDHHMVRLRTGLLSPQLEIGYNEQTSDLQFGRARIPAAGLSLWLPESLRIRTMAEGQLWEEQHHYSNFHLYKAKTKIILQPN